jgi:hypothetical protein
MATTYNNNLRIAEIGTGDQAGVWGVTTNYNLATLITEAITGVVSITVTGNQALQALDGLTDQARQAVLLLTGTPVGAFTLYTPPLDKVYIVKNSTGQTATISAATLANGTTPTGGTTVALPNGYTTMVYCDGTNIVDFGNLYASGNAIFNGTGGLRIPVGNTAQQAGGQGTIRYNTQLTRFEGNDGTDWGSLGGGATGGGSEEVFFLNDQSVTVSYSIPSAKNAMTTGPITIDNGVTVTVPSGSRWVVL